MRDAFIRLPGAPPALPQTFAAAWDALRGVTVDRNRNRHVDRIALGENTLFAKFFHRPRLGDLVRNLATAPRARSQAEREVLLAGALEASGLRAVRPVAFGQRSLGPFERSSLLVTLAQPGPTLGALLRAEPGRIPAWAGRVAALLHTLFRNRFYLPDLSLEHLLVAPDGALVLLDLHNGGRRAPTPRRAARMLGRLWAGARDTVRPRLALCVSARVLAPWFGRGGRRRCLARAARLGERWEARERRKRAAGAAP